MNPLQDFVNNIHLHECMCVTKTVKNHKIESYLQGGVTYTTLYNLLNYPSGCVPVTRVTAIDENNMRDYPESNLTLKMVKKVGSLGTNALLLPKDCVARNLKTKSYTSSHETFGQHVNLLTYFDTPNLKVRVSLKDFQHFI